MFSTGLGGGVGGGGGGAAQETSTMPSAENTPPRMTIIAMRSSKISCGEMSLEVGGIERLAGGVDQQLVELEPAALAM